MPNAAPPVKQYFAFSEEELRAIECALKSGLKGASPEVFTLITLTLEGLQRLRDKAKADSEAL